MWAEAGHLCRIATEKYSVQPAGWSQVSENHLGGARCVTQFDGDSELVATFTFRLNGGRAQQRDNGTYQCFRPGQSFFSSPYPGAKQFSLPRISLELFKLLSCC